MENQIEAGLPSLPHNVVGNELLYLLWRTTDHISTLIGRKVREPMKDVEMASHELSIDKPCNQGLTSADY